MVKYFQCEQPWLKICEFFCCLPFAATINGKILAVHGGITENLVSLEQIKMIKRPYDTPDCELPFNLIHSSPTHCR